MDERLERALDRNATRLERETEGRLERSLVRRALRRLAERTEDDMDGLAVAYLKQGDGWVGTRTRNARKLAERLGGDAYRRI